MYTLYNYMSLVGLKDNNQETNKAKSIHHKNFIKISVKVIFIFAFLFVTLLLMSSISRIKKHQTSITKLEKELKEQTTIAEKDDMKKYSQVEECAFDDVFKDSGIRLVKSDKKGWNIVDGDRNIIKLNVRYSSEHSYRNETTEIYSEIIAIDCPSKSYKIEDEERYFVTWENDIGFIDFEKNIFEEFFTLPDSFPLNTVRIFRYHPTINIALLTTGWEGLEGLEYILDYTNAKDNGIYVLPIPVKTAIDSSLALETYYNKSDDSNISTFEWTNNGVVVRSMNREWKHFDEREDVKEVCGDYSQEVEKSEIDKLEDKIINESDNNYIYLLST